MAPRIRTAVLPEQQRRTLDELTEDLDLRSGDAASKLSAFWTMLTLSSVIATAGVITDSTATVIGAMIIAPLSTPIMGIALGIAKRQRNASLLYVVTGGSLVVLIGVLGSLVMPSSYDLLANSQIASRTSPGLLDLIAAIATGLAGAVALARRDVAAVLPGVAIAISLVPPLAVVGVCLGQGAFGLAVGAFLLFFSNVLAMVLAGMITFTFLGYATEGVPDQVDRPGHHKVVLGVLLLLITLPLAANTVVVYEINVWQGSVRDAAEHWLRDTQDAEITGVEFASTTATITVRHTGDLPPFDELMDDLDDVLPDGIHVVVDTTVGQESHIGVIGG
jgi:uncharacterized hydrophobic protein (TIGR00271 family)